MTYMGVGSAMSTSCSVVVDGTVDVVVAGGAEADHADTLCQRFLVGATQQESGWEQHCRDGDPN